jgi:hypothetical protein
MDTANTIGVIGGYVAIALGVIGAAWAALNHHRIRSKCCGQESSLSVESIDTKPAGFQAATEEKPKVAVECPMS